MALTLLSRQPGHRSQGPVSTPNSSPPVHPGHLQSHHSHTHHHSYPLQHGNMNAANRSSITGPHPVDVRVTFGYFAYVLHVVILFF